MRRCTPPREWIDRYAGRFDAGWDALRETIFARQKALGVVPKDAVLTPRADEMRAWESLDDEERRVATRLMEVYAGFLAHTDEQIGRVFDALREMEVFDDTLVLYVVGDNGGSGEGGADYGTWNEMGRIQGVVQTPAGAPRTARRSRRAELLSALLGGLGLGDEYALSLGEAGRVASRRHAQSARRELALGHAQPRRAALAVRTRERRRAHDPRGGRCAGAGRR
ncbi:MAG: sulfatase-like hydrolase/transferase [Myxococcota bacterium]